MPSRTHRASRSRGIFNLTQAAIHAVTAMCWLGILGALCAVPLVFLRPARLLDAIEPSVVAEHGDAPHLLLHFSAGLLAIVGLLALGLMFLRHLQRFVRSVREQQPFTRSNVTRLQRMAWLMLAMEVLSILIGLYASWMGPQFAWMEVGGGMSVTGLIAVLMLFVIAQVFTVGTAMREDLDGVV